jgi:predicted MFS family arabinose efflux permease
MKRDPARFVVAICAANGLAFIIPNTSPFVIGGLVDGFPMSEADAGLVLTVELLAMGAAALCVAPFMRVISQRTMVVFAALLTATANAVIVLGLADGFTALTVVRVVAGAGAGLLLAGANAAIAASISPSRLYGFALMVGWFVAAALGPVMAKAVGLASFTGAYAVWMVLALITAPLVLGIAHKPAPTSEESLVPDSGMTVGTIHLAGIVLVGLAMMAYFAFVERLSQHVGFTLQQTGILFAAISIAGALGAGLASLHGDRYGLVRPLLIGTAVHAAAIVVAVTSGNKWLFAVGAMLEGVSFMYLLAYQLAVAATFDANGKWAAAASGAMIGSTGVGPYIGGAIITAYGFSALNWLIVGTAVVAIGAFGWVGRHAPLRESAELI